MANKFSAAFEMTLSERVELPNGKRQNKEVGKAKIPCPILSDFGIQAEQAVDKENGKPAFNNGLPLYTDARMDFLQDAVQSLVSVRSRNKFEGGQLKAGMSLPEDFETLFETSGRTGEALAIRREARVSFEAYLQGLNKKAATVALLSDLFQNSSKVLNAAAPNFITALADHSVKWVEGLSETERLRFMPKISELQESINNAVSAQDLDDLAA